MRVGILGGSFNPPHLGHLALARTVLDQGLVDRVLCIPAGIPPHKTLARGAADADRLAMTRLQAEADPRLDVSDIELCRPGRSYSIDTVHALLEQNPYQELHLIIGSDMAKIFAQWRQWQDLLRLAPPLVAQRPDHVLDPNPVVNYPGMDAAQWAVLEHGRFCMSPVAVNSTLVRQRIAAGAADAELQTFVLPSVLAYIRQHSLYV